MTTPDNSLLSIYLHIPFCSTKCTYCAFNTYINQEHLIEPFIDALTREIEIVGSTSPLHTVGTIYFGGGTPTLLQGRHFERLLDTITQYFNVVSGAEITTEANPNDLSVACLEQLKGIGINRLSIGMQSANQNELDLFARHHDLPTVLNAFIAARRAGFENLSLDLIYGFPYQTLSSWERSLAQVIELEPEHVSFYALGVEEGTPMAVWIDKGKLPPPDDDLTADMYDLATEQLASAGFDQYEISNWCRNGLASQHNLQYWRNLPYVGLGPGAHGFAGGVRYATLLSPQRYIKALRESAASYEFPLTPAVDSADKVGWEQEIAETLMMSLRLTQEGVSLQDFHQRFDVDLLDLHGDVLSRFAEQGLVEISNERVRITQAGRLLSNIVFRELI